MDPADLLARLSATGATLALAESLTGGLLADAFIAVPGASAVVRGSIVAYATDLKATLLGVDAELLRAHGAVHPEVAEQMAAGVRERMEATYGVATTGVAGPDPQDGQPVGTVYVGLAGPNGRAHARLDLHGDRAMIRAGAVAGALALLTEHTS